MIIICIRNMKIRDRKIETTNETMLPSIGTTWNGMKTKLTRADIGTKRASAHQGLLHRCFTAMSRCSALTACVLGSRRHHVRKMWKVGQ